MTARGQVQQRFDSAIRQEEGAIPRTWRHGRMDESHCRGHVGRRTRGDASSQPPQLKE